MHHMHPIHPEDSSLVNYSSMINSNKALPPVDKTLPMFPTNNAAGFFQHQVTGNEAGAAYGQILSNDQS